MKKLVIILLGLAFINNATAQNTLDKIGLSAGTPAAGAFSLRLLSTSYAGAAIQVRRSSDNAVQDIGFIAGGNLDTIFLKAFVTTNIGYVATWYDQSGNGMNATQASSANQPVIVNAGMVTRQNGSPCMTFSGSQWLSLSMGFVRATYPNATVNIVYQNTSLTGSQGLWGCDDGGWDRLQLLNFAASPSVAYGLSNGGGTVANATNNTNQNIYTAIMNYGAANGTYVVINGIAGTSFTEGGGGSTGNLAIGAIGSSGSYPFIGNASEFLLFTTSLSGTDRQIVESNQAAFYKVDVPVITTQPSATDQKICINSTVAALSVSATATGTLSYQWYSNPISSNVGGTLISGATSSTYTPPGSVAGTVYYYVVITSSGMYSVTSDVSVCIIVQNAVSATITGSDPTCLANGSIFITNPQGLVTNYINADFSGLPAGATLLGSAVISGGECILTPAQSGQQGYIAFPVMAAAPTSFTASFDYRVADGSGADGMSFNYGNLSAWGYYEYGINTGLVLRFIEYGSSRVEVAYNGTTITSVPFALVNTNYRTCIVTISADNKISLSFGGTLVFDNVPLPAGYSSADKSAWQFAFASRCGGQSNKHSIKNVVLNSDQSQYSIDGNMWQTNPIFSAPGGVYTVLGKPGNNSLGCPVSEIGTITLTAPPSPTAVISGTTIAFDSVTLTTSGGVSYLWSGGNSTTTAQNTFTSSGSFSVTVRDSAGCADIANTIVTVNLLGLNKYGSVTYDSANNVNENGAIGASSKVNRYGRIRSHGSNGLTAATAGASAYEIKQNFPASTDGYYWIKNPNINGGAPFKIYADMTTDGGGWTLILCNSSNAGWTYTNAIALNTTSPSVNSNYSIIGWADYIKKSASGFQYMIDANARRSNGGIWTANGAYTFLNSNNTQTNITINTKFGTWTYNDSGIEQIMPWYSNCSGAITTSGSCGGNWWGTLVSLSGFNPAPWIGGGCGVEGCMTDPGIIWYWVR